MSLKHKLGAARKAIHRVFNPRFEIRLTYGEPSHDPDRLAAQTIFRMDTNRSSETIFPPTGLSKQVGWIRILDRDSGRIHQQPLKFFVGPYQDLRVDLTTV